MKLHISREITYITYHYKYCMALLLLHDITFHYRRSQPGSASHGAAPPPPCNNMYNMYFDVLSYIVFNGSNVM
jgi:hypothetical protein